MYEPIYPISPALFGLLIRSVPLAIGVPYSRYSVIIPLYNKEKTIEKCVESVLKQTKKPSQVIIIDDASTDKSQELAFKIEENHKIVKVLHNLSNKGKAESINLALKEVKYSFVLILDADTYLEEDFAQKTLSGFYRKDVKGVCGFVLPDNITTPYEYDRLIQYLYGQRLYKMIQTKIHGLWVLSGCATIWRTKFLLKNKYPSETVVEDMEASWMAQEKFLLNFNPKAICYTTEPSTFKSYFKQIERWFSIRCVAEKYLCKARLGLKTTFFWFIGESIGYLAYLGFLLWNILSGNILGTTLMLLIDGLITMGICLYVGHQYKVPLRKVLKGIPYYYLFRLVNTLVFWKGLIKPKRKWEK